MTDTDTTTEHRAPRSRYGWPSIAVAVVAGVLYAYVLWNAIGNLISLPKALGDATPWWLLIVGVAVPVVAYLAAFLLGRRHSLLPRALFFLIGLTVIACSTVGSIAFVQTH
ncbi:MAG: hypothetical protein WDM88_10530 [Galbitalea sp.]